MLLPGRDTWDPQYRFGFNGKENELDFRGVGQITDYGARIYNARLGKFLSVDPLQKLYPWLTPFQFSENSPIANIDLDGLESSWAADGRIIQGPFISDPLNGKRMYSKPPPNTLAYYADHSRTAPQQTAGSAQLSRPKQDNTQLPAQLQQSRAVANTLTSNKKAYEDHISTYGIGMTLTPEAAAGSPFSGQSSTSVKEYNPFLESRSDFERVMITNPATQAIATGLGAGFLAMEAPAFFKPSLELAGTKAVLSMGFQAIVNGPRNIDFVDVGGDAFLAPGASSLIGGALDVKPFALNVNEKFGAVGLNKSFSQFSTDAATGFIFGTVGDKFKGGLEGATKAVTSFEKNALYISTQSPWIFTQQQTNKELNQPK